MKFYLICLLIAEVQHFQRFEAVEVFVFLGYDAALLDHRCPTSGKNVVLLSPRVKMSHEEYFVLDETTMLS
jgi:hypothetical protein